MTLEKLHVAFDQYKDSFVGSFHSALWAVCADNVTKSKLACFVWNFDSNGLRLGIAIANKPGYIPTPAYFKDKDHEQADEILEAINLIIFGHTPETCEQIKLSSMFDLPNLKPQR